MNDVGNDKKGPAIPAGTDYRPTEGHPEEGGKISPEDAIRIQSDDLPSEEPEEREDRKKVA